MEVLTSREMTSLLLALAILLGLARLLGELAQRIGQASVLGELLAGIFLGPTILGRFAPQWEGFLFPPTGHGAVALDALTGLAITLFLLVAGMEVDLSAVWKQGKTAIAVSLGGIVIPFGVGLATAWIMPRLLGREHGADPLIFALFFSTALSISALPVIAKTLMDLYLYRSDLGMIVIAAAVVNDLLGWIIFAVILGMMGTAADRNLGVPHTILLTLGFTIVVLTAGRWLINRSLLWVQAYTTWPGGVLGLALVLAFLGAAFTEWAGIHAIFGAFIVGVAIGDSPHLREKTRAIIGEFISFIFAPLFFASIGLKLDFLSHFRLDAVLVVLVIACVGKIVGCGLAARLAGMGPRESWAIGFGMNARGAMEIVLALLALQYGVIRERMFVAVVVMALVTSAMSGPLMQRILRRKRRYRLTDYLTPRTFIPSLRATDRREVVETLSQSIASAHGLDPQEIAWAVTVRESVMSTGLGNGIAVPHARIEALGTPLVAVGVSNEGVDFNAPDGQPAHLVFLLITPKHDSAAQIELLADIARAFANEESRRRGMRAASLTEFVAAVRAQ